MRRLFLFLALMLAAALGWRWASRRRQLPCPSWAAWLLDNPITEILGDPHYQSRATVLQLCQAAGFRPAQRWGTALAFTQNVTKPL